MKLPGGTASGSTPSPRSPRPSACTAPQCTATSTRRADIAAGPQDAPRHAGQAARRVLLRRNTAIDAEPAQLVAAAVQVALQSGAPQRRRRKAACSSRQPRAAVLRWQRLPDSFGARDTSVNGTQPGVRPGNPPSRPCPPGCQPGRVPWPRSGEGASRPRARARATASARVCVPSLAYRWVMWVLTVLCEMYSSPPICRIDRLVGR